MKITINLPGWLNRLLVMRELTKSPYLLSGYPCSRSGATGEKMFSLSSTSQLDPDVRKFIVDGMEEHGCDALTFVKMARAFPGVSTKFILSLKVND